MALRKKVKTPKLKDTDREYLVKTDDTAVIYIKSFAAACRYGAKTKWCISTPSNTYWWKTYRRSKIFYFVFLHRNTPKEYKICITVSRRSRVLNLKGWGQNRDNQELSEQLVEMLMGDELLDTIKQHAKGNRKLVFLSKKHSYCKGQYIEGNRKHIISYSTGRLKRPPTRYGFVPSCAIVKINIREKYIKKAEVIEVADNGYSMKIKIIELHNTPKSMEDLEAFIKGATFNVRTHSSWAVLS